MLLLLLAGHRVQAQPDCITSARIVGSISTRNARDIIVDGTHAFVADQDGGIVVLDVSAPRSPIMVGSVETPGPATSLALVGNHLYVTALDAGLLILDVSNPSSPSILGTLRLPNDARRVSAQGTYAYVMDDSGLRVIDVAIASTPVLVATVVTPGNAVSVTVAGDYAYVSDGYSGVQVVDIATPSTPRIVGLIRSWVYASRVAIIENYAYVGGSNAGLQIFDVANPLNPKHVASMVTGGSVTGLEVLDGYAYLVSGSTLKIIDVTNPEDLQTVADLGTPGLAQDVCVAGNYAYVADGWLSGVHVVDISVLSSVEYVAAVNTPGVALGFKLVDNFAYVADGGAGLSAIDVTNPAAPFVLASIGTGAYSQDIAVVGNFAFIASNGGNTGPPYFERTPGALRVVDISVPSAPVLIGSLDAPDMDAQGIAVRGDYAFVADHGANIYQPEPRLYVIDVSNPAVPRVVASVDTPGMPSGVAVDGVYAYVAAGLGGLLIVDVSDPTAPRIDASVDTPSSSMRVTVLGDYAYVAETAGPIGDDLTLNNGGLRIVDVSAPTAPRLVASLDTPEGATDVRVIDGVAYVSDNSGTQIIDVSEPTSPSIVGRVDAPAFDLVADARFFYALDRWLQLVVYRWPCVPTAMSASAYDLRASMVEDAVHLNWQLPPETLAQVSGVYVQSSFAEPGPYVTITPQPLTPHNDMRFVDPAPGDSGWGADSIWYRLGLENKEGTMHFSDPIRVDLRHVAQMTSRLVATTQSPTGLQIRYTIAPNVRLVHLAVYDIRGRLAKVLHHGQHQSGVHTRVWNGLREPGVGAASGIYLIRLQADATVDVRKSIWIQ